MLNLAKDREDFLKGCEQLGICLTNSQLERIDAYVFLLQKWQEHFNLIGPKTIPFIYTRHILDSIQVLPYFKGKDKVLDIGTGAGLPSVVLAIMGVKDVNAVERNGKKCQFLRTVRRELGLQDCFTVHNCDVNTLKDQNLKFDAITARAFASLEDILTFSYPLLGDNSIFVLPKGESYSSEILQTTPKFMMTTQTYSSITNAYGVILVINSVSRETN